MSKYMDVSWMYIMRPVNLSIINSENMWEKNQWISVCVTRPVINTVTKVPLDDFITVFSKLAYYHMAEW